MMLLHAPNVSADTPAANTVRLSTHATT